MKTHVPLVIGMSLGLVACGGGGGGGGGGTSSGAVTVNYDGPSVTTEANLDTQVQADEAISSAVGAVSGMDSSGTGNFKAGTATSTESPLKLAVDQSVARLLASANVVAGVTQTDQCQPSDAMSGTITVDSGEADPNTVTTGDYVNITFSHCWLDSTTEMHGVMNSKVTNVTGTPSDPPTSNWGMAMSMDMGFYMKSTDGLYMAMDGGFSASVDYVFATDSQTATLAGDSLAMELSDGTNRFTQLLTAFNFSTTEGYSSGDVTAANYDFTVTNNLIGGSVTVTTTVPFAQDAYESYPHSGEIVVTGANNSSVKLTVESSTYVTISYDTDGDGAFGADDVDSVEPTTRPGVLWTEL